MRILINLRFWQLRNQVKKALRSPKQIVPALLILLWFCSMTFFSTAVPSQHAPVMMARANTMRIDQLWFAVFIAMAAFTVYRIVKSFSESMISFNLPDFDYLFPAPISRRSVIAMKLLAIYGKTGLMAFFMSLLFMPNLRLFIGEAKPSALLIPSLGIMLFGAFLVNTCTAINLIAAPREGGSWWPTWIVRCAAYALLAFTAGDLVAGYFRYGGLLPSISDTFTQSIYLFIFLPVKWTADLISTAAGANVPSAGTEIAGLFALALASFLLVISRKENPYEPSLEISTRVASVRQAMRSGGLSRVRVEMRRMRMSEKRHADRGIPPFGRGAMALFWKNLNISVRLAGKRIVWYPILVAAFFIVLKTQVPHLASGDLMHIEIITITLLGYVMYVLAMLMMQTFRGDLKQANILKPMPIPAWQVVLVPVLNGSLLLALLVWMVIGLEVAILGISNRSPLIPTALCLPVIACSLLAWQSVVAIMYPNWDDAGQRFIASLVLILVIGLAVGPAIVVSLVLWLFHASTLVIFLGNAVVAGGIAVGGIAVATRLYRKYDPTD